MSLVSLLQAGRKVGASDIHVVAGLPPLFRVSGQIITSRGEALDEPAVHALAMEMLNDNQRQRLETDLALCFSSRFGAQDRARITIYFRNGCPELAIRLSETAIRTRADLGLPKLVDEWARKPNGLVIITGPTGVGKTTTFHYMIDQINAEFRKKIITLEDPIEYTHLFQRSIVIQQEIMSDVLDFPSALRHVLRQDPDVIGVGEMRDQDTIRTALMAAETGHLVIATLHTPGAVEVIQRITSSFPMDEQPEIRLMLANTLQAVIAQQLLPRATGAGRVLCAEVMVATPAIRSLVRENALHRIYSEIQSGRKHGMITLEHALLELYQRGDISYDTAVEQARYPEQITNRSA